ncbi:MarR family transcriptional regulator [Breoghania sp.]|uniref:MarR family winged helix-turn-helix transcriptional regulator n=1 Tax=Breoghania sp. TaxID=2065378 RepID=UPI002AA5EA96|nr:MarR family transcriptional regulator [Breoghania sp.]
MLHLESWLPYRLFRISVRIADVLNAFYAPRFGLSRSAWRTMSIVANRPGASAKEICQAAGLDQFAVSRAIRQLVELGFARRLSGRTDRRYASIELSKRGWEVFSEISDLAGRLDRELTEVVSSDELARLDSILNRLDNASAGVLARGWQGAREGPGPEGPETEE